jgi:hypothetical protein
MPTGSKAQALARDARFVFVGTIQRLRAATMDDVPLDDRTAIVRVDQIVHAPDVLAQYTGHDITVRLGGRGRVREGMQATFYTSGWLFGDSIAVESFAHEEVRQMAAAAQDAGDPVHRLRLKETQARFDAAPVVVSGRVTSVRMPADVVAATAVRARRAAEPIGPISEHDPDWRIADIQVDEVHKGSVANDTVSVRFPSSQDVMWHDAPKFHPGEEGVFMLHRTAAAGKRLAAARAVPVKDAGEFVMPQSTDFVAWSEPGARSLIAAAAGRSARSAEEEREVPASRTAPRSATSRKRTTTTRRSARSRKRGA